ncbi:MAG: hypothetical protein FJY82_02460 [Candidatus Aminicenantes bacterium]|nr:hypothetical protein [Candidatus Aminicenantes bacterium]
MSLRRNRTFVLWAVLGLVVAAAGPAAPQRGREQAPLTEEQKLLEAMHSSRARRFTATSRSSSRKNAAAA